jgi:hypothetical protein
MKTPSYAITAVLACTLALTSAAAGSPADTPTDKSTVFIYYIPGEGPKTFAADVAIDGQAAVHLRRGIVFKTVLEPGSHDFLVTGLTAKRYTCRLESGKDTYLRIVNKPKTFGIYAVGHAATFELVTKDQAELDISQGQLVPPDSKDLRPRKK